MTHKEQVISLANDIDNLIKRYRDEYDLLYADVVGVLFMKAKLLCDEASEEDEE